MHVIAIMLAMIFLLTLQPIAIGQQPPEPPGPDQPWNPPPPSGTGYTGGLTVIPGPGGGGAAAAWMTDYQYNRQDHFSGSETLYLFVVSPYASYFLWWYEYYPSGNVPQGHWMMWSVGPLSGGMYVLGPMSPEPSEPYGLHAERVWMMDAASSNFVDAIARWSYDAPAPSTIPTSSQISLSQSQVNPGEQVFVTASVSPAPTGGTLSISLSESGQQWNILNSAQASTGSVSVNWSPPGPGTYNFKATFSGYTDTGANKIYSQSESAPARLVVQLIQTTLTLSVSPSSTSIDVLTRAVSSVTLTGTLTPSISGAYVLIAISGPSGQTSRTEVTGPGGSFSESFTPSQAGVYTISASYPGDATHQPSQAGSSTVTVTETWTTALVIVGIVVVAVIAIVLFLMFRRKGGRGKPQGDRGRQHGNRR
jgi:hypothetical protein